MLHTLQLSVCLVVIGDEQQQEELGLGIYPQQKKPCIRLRLLYIIDHHSPIPIPSTDSHSTYILPPFLIAPPHHSIPSHCNNSNDTTTGVQ